MRKPFVAGNWKMHGSKASIKELITGLNQLADKVGEAQVAICPPAIYIDYANNCLSASNIAMGAQNLCTEPKQGAFTGEVSAQMILDMGCKYVIVGHSERRAYYGETDNVVAEKVAVALQSGLIPILCVGETLEEREADQVEAVISTQLNAILERVGIQAFETIVIAYEPIWAIGTGKTASSAQAQEVHAFIRGQLAKRDESVAIFKCC